MLDLVHGDVPAPTMTEEEYLARVRAEEWQAEYIHGIVYEMTGGTGSHSQIAASLTFQTGLALGDKPCTVFSQSLSVHVAKVSAYFSPDLSVVCGKPLPKLAAIELRAECSKPKG